MIFDRRFGFIHAPNFGPTRTLPQKSREFGKLGGSSNCEHFDESVIVIANPAADAQQVGRLLHKVAKPDALHVSSHAVPAG